jgi:acyl dehydratase
VSGQALPAYRIKARNTHGENPIHDDETARRHGFRGALVPGVTVYGYLTHPLVEALGAAWLERGTASVRFVRPVLDGEEVAIEGAVTAHDARGLRARLTASTTAAGVCAELEATLPSGTPTPVNLARYETAPLPATRPEATRALLDGLGVLGTPVTTYDEPVARAWLERVADALALYRGPDARVHPAFYLDQANRALDRNVRLGPWIHVSSVLRHLGPARLGDRLETRGRVRSLFEKKGREFVELDLVLLAGAPARPLAHVLHTAIYRLPPPA